MEKIDELQEKLDEESNIEDLDTFDDAVPARYDITSYGIDFDVDGLVRRIQRGDIYIPEFQREFVWKMTESSRFIESLLLGLPVPGIFLAQEQETGKMLVIDGQQRLLTLKYFFEGYFHGSADSATRRVFTLSKVQDVFEGKTYEQLDGKDRNNLDNSVIHATVVKQDSPADDDTSIYHIFERLNSGGRKLNPQEIRCAVYHGAFIDFLKIVNDYESWRSIFGKKHSRMRDQELILRFFAMLYQSDNYKRPMVEFLNKYLKENRYINRGKADELSNIFATVTDLYVKSVKGRLFRVSHALNVAFFEAAMVGLAKRIETKGIPSTDEVNRAYQSLLNNPDFVNSIVQSTAGVSSVETRIGIATESFMEV